MDRPSSSRMAVASFLTSGSMRIVVACMFDGMASPLLVNRGATILPPLCGGRGPVVDVGRLLHTPCASCRATVRSAAPGSAAMKVRRHLNQAR